MIASRDPWVHRETGWSSVFAAQSESRLALSNGYLGLRGTLDEGEPAAVRGTYLNGFYEARPIAYADRGYGDPELDQVLVGVTDGTRIQVIVEGDPLDVRTGTIGEHERVLDLRAGTLRRTLRWRSPGGHEIRVRSRRLVSLAHRELAATSTRSSRRSSLCASPYTPTLLSSSAIGRSPTTPARARCFRKAPSCRGRRWRCVAERCSYTRRERAGT